MRSKVWILAIVFVLILSCNLPMQGAAPVEQATLVPPAAEDAVGTSVALTTAARMMELAVTVPVGLPPSETPTIPPPVVPTQCTPSVTATTAANIRSGPDTVYDVIGALQQNASTTVAGRNDANTWWYILLPGSTTSYGWISGTVVTASCLPQVVQVVAAPPTPIQPTSTSTLPPPVAGKPDLVASGMQYWPRPAKNGQPISIQVKVTNSGTAPAGNFKVAWLSNQSQAGCSWGVVSLGVGESKNLDCTFTYHGNATASYWITLVVDTTNLVIESDEGNNSRDGTLEVKP
jgi:hypothetical protein